MSLTAPELQVIKNRMKTTWTSGDYGLVARSLERGTDEFVNRLGIPPGAQVLDVACGSGNVAIAAARRGARVTGLDIAPNLLEQARARASAEGLDARFDEGDAEGMPYGDRSFDVVVTMFGAMFTPRPAMTAAELVRVCRPGGTVAMANWTPEGFSGQMFRTVGRHVPPPPNVPPPVLWGEERVVRERLQAGIASLHTSKRLCPIQYSFPPGDVVQLFRGYFGPVKLAFDALDAAGQAALQRDLEQLWTAHNRAADGGTLVESEYLEVLARRE